MRTKISKSCEGAKARTAIEENVIVPSYLTIYESPVKGKGIKSLKKFEVGEFVTFYYGKICRNFPKESDVYCFEIKQPAIGKSLVVYNPCTAKRNRTNYHEPELCSLLVIKRGEMPDYQGLSKKIEGDNSKIK